MRSSLKRYYHKNKLYSYICRYIINFKNYPLKSYYKICEERKKYDVWQYEEISRDMKMYLEDISPDGALYGINYWLKEYGNIKKKINMYVEHGLYFGNLVRENSIDSIYKATITFSDNRKNIIEEKSSKNVIKVGPYIHYANDYYDDKKIMDIRNENGKTMLFFPPHSISGYNAKYNVKDICNRLKYYKKEYKTILICLFYQDINEGLAYEFEKNGFKVVSAGHYYDYNFLSRLKSIIKLADHTVSMAIGTHIGYCIYMGKSHEIINTDINCKSFTDENKIFNIVRDSEIEDRGKNYIETFMYDEEVILSNFFNSGNIISDKQMEICNKYWGFNEIKDKKHLRLYLEKQVD